MKCPICKKSDEVVTRPDGPYCLDCGSAVLVPSDATACSSSFAQEYMGTFTKPPAKAKIGDIAANLYTGHRSKIVEALDRADGRIYAILESRIHCVIPSPNWGILENV